MVLRGLEVCSIRGWGHDRFDPPVTTNKETTIPFSVIRRPAPARFGVSLSLGLGAGTGAGSGPGLGLGLGSGSGPSAGPLRIDVAIAEGTVVTWRPGGSVAVPREYTHYSALQLVRMAPDPRNKVRNRGGRRDRGTWVRWRDMDGGGTWVGWMDMDGGGTWVMQKHVLRGSDDLRRAGGDVVWV